MIGAVTTKQRRQRYLAACRGKPFFGCLLPVQLRLFGKSGGCFFAGPTLAVDANGERAVAAGHANPEELAAFLALTGRHWLLTDGPAPAGWRVGGTLHLFGLEPGSQLPLPPLPAGFVLNEQPRLGPVADLLMAAEPARRDSLYAELCVKRNHGMGMVWTLERADAPGQPVCTVSAAALYGAEAYMACGETAAVLRGQGLGGHLIVRMANSLAAGHRHVTFLCREERVRFYTRLGFERLGTMAEYTDLPAVAPHHQYEKEEPNVTAIF